MFPFFLVLVLDIVKKHYTYHFEEKNKTNILQELIPKKK